MIRKTRYVLGEICDDAIYVFGDNSMRRGNRGQAIIRCYDNSHGIRTKKAPTRNGHMSDDEFNENVSAMLEDWSLLFSRIGEYSDSDPYLQRYKVYFPSDGVGTGFARLPTEAPRTFNALEKMIEFVDMLLGKNLFVEGEHLFNDLAKVFLSSPQRGEEVKTKTGYAPFQESYQLYFGYNLQKEVGVQTFDEICDYISYFENLSQPLLD